MIKKSFIAFVSLIGLMTTLASCEDWGKMDPAAGIDVYPTRAKVATYSFNESTNIEELEYIKSVDGSACEIVYDDSLYSQVLHVSDGTVANVFNPLTVIQLQNGAGFTFWLRTPEGVEPGSMLSAGGTAIPMTGLPTDGLWHFVGVQVKKDGYDIYSDGQLVNTIAADNTAFIEPLNLSENIGLGGNNQEYWIDDISFVRNQMTEKDVARPAIKKGEVKLPEAVYFNDFNSGAGDAEIVGAGSIRNDEATGFNKVFQNVGGALRSNYLKLPSHVLSHSAESQEMTIGFWVNAVNAGEVNVYTYAPFFTAYGSAPNPTNGAPMMALQSRGPVQLNNNGWCDFTSANHVDGKVNVFNENAWEAGDGNFNFVNNWLADLAWHYYAITFKANEVTQYMDGVVTNQWELDGVTEGQVITGLFNNGADLNYICLGGNQAWDWGDNDGGFAFDDFVVYDKALSGSQIEKIIEQKAAAPVSLPTPVYLNEFTTNNATIVGAGSIATDDDSHFGSYFQNVAGAKSTNYLQLPADALSHSAESKEMSICFWVNAKNAGTFADYCYSPFFTAYASAPNGDNGAPMLALQSRGPIQLNNNGWCDFTSANHVDGKVNIYNQNAWEAGDAAYNFVNNWLDDQAWHYYCVTFTETEAIVYLDGEVKNHWVVDGTSEGQIISGLFSNGADLSYICVGGNQAWNWGDPDAGFGFDDVAIYDMALSQSDIANIIAAKHGQGGGAAGPEAYYRNTFDSSEGLQIVGGGSFTNDDVHGKVFQNITGGKRQNYLLLPSDLLSHSGESEQFSMSVWVNAANAGASGDYMWAPLFMAYAAAPDGGANTYPMFACQYRGVLQLNCAGWTDYTDVQNVAGANKLYHDATDWLADKKWHLYTVVLDGENAKVYLDGTLANEWNMDGTSNTQKGLYTNGADLKYICLGGNQAWDWNDNDPGFAFDDIQLFDFALSESDIQAILSQY
ncbi:MAG: LamG domain-containing protein [Prevotella sp.]|nr:LamG domain-containing protein [Prevotella sp.]